MVAVDDDINGLALPNNTKNNSTEMVREKAKALPRSSRRWCCFGIQSNCFSLSVVVVVGVEILVVVALVVLGVVLVFEFRFLPVVGLVCGTFRNSEEERKEEMTCKTVRTPSGYRCFFSHLILCSSFQSDRDSTTIVTSLRTSSKLCWRKPRR